MRHRVKKIKFKNGYDANRALVKKLVYNFLTRGKIKTTLAKAKVLKSKVEWLVEKMKEENEKNKSFFIKYFGRKKLFYLFFKVIGPVFKDIVGGYVRIVKLGKRDSDGAEMAKVEWTKPVVYPQKNNRKNKTKGKKNKKPKETKKNKEEKKVVKNEK